MRRWRARSRSSGSRGAAIRRRPSGDVLLFGVTAVELAALVFLTPMFGVADWIYVLQHVIVLAIAMTRPLPQAQDHSPGANTAVAVSITYPYAQVIYLQSVPGLPAWPAGGLALIVVAACLSLASLCTIRRSFGIRPALRGTLATSGPYRLMRHPMYLSYMLGDLGYNLQEWNPGTVLLTAAGWASLIYRIHAEERVLSRSPQWSRYESTVRGRLVPGIW